MRVSVVLPTYNGQRFVSEAIHSVLQHPSVGELIVVDDCSSDQTVELVSNIAQTDSRVALHTFANNRGVAAARNFGARLAHYEWLSFIDQDDLWESDRCLNLGGLAASHNPLILMGHQRCFLDPSAGTEGKPDWVKEEWLEVDQPGWVLGAVLMTKETVDVVGAFNEEWREGTDDFDWFLRAKALGVPIIQSEECVLLRRIHANNRSRMVRPAAELLKSVRSFMNVTRNP